MKVHIGPYKDWIGPYQIAEKILFWKDRNDDVVYKLGSWLATGQTNTELSSAKEHKTWLYKLCLFIQSKKERKIKVKIDRWDTWSMDNTLAYIILPMLQQLKETTHGSPHIDDDDVPEELKSTSAPPKENEWDIDDNHHKRWEWVLDEMIFAFKHKVDDSWEEKFCSGEHDIIWEKTDKTFFNDITQKEEETYEMKKGPNDTYECDYEGMEKFRNRMKNGFRLFGKYYEGLWD